MPPIISSLSTVSLSRLSSGGLVGYSLNPYQNPTYGGLTYGNFIAFNEREPDLYKTVNASNGSLIDSISINGNTSYGTVSVLDNVFFTGGSYLEILSFDGTGNLVSRDQRTMLPYTSYTPDFDSEFLYFVENNELKKVRYKTTSSSQVVFSDAAYLLDDRHETFIDFAANLYARTTDDRVCKIDTSSGSLIWATNIIDSSNRPLCVDFEGDVIVLGRDNVTVINSSDGSVKSSFPTSGNQGISVDSQNNIVTASNFAVAAKHDKTGNLIWSYSSSLNNCYSVLIDFNDDIYLLDNDGQEKISSAGAQVWQNSIPGNLSTQAGTAPFALQMRHYAARVPS